ncbi:hypothetical protein Tco_0111807 [Tanacetum coccineum]
MIDHEILGSFCVNYFEFELLKEENPPEQSRLGIFFSKEIFEGGVIRIHNAFVQDESVFLKKMSHWSGNFGKILNEPSVETGMTEKTPNTLDGDGMRASCGELDAQPSPPDEGVMTFLRKKVKTGAVVGKRVLLQVLV